MHNAGSARPISLPYQHCEASTIEVRLHWHEIEQLLGAEKSALILSSIPKNDKRCRPYCLVKSLTTVETVREGRTMPHTACFIV